MRFVRFVLLAAALTGFAAGTVVVARFAGTNQVIAQGFAAAQLSDSELGARLRAQGYTDIQILRRESGHVNVRATKDGQTADLTVDPATGAIANPAARDDDDD
jgi:hypothetical protein